MELIPQTLNYDFIGKRRLFIFGSLIVNLLIIIAAATFRPPNWGVDFAGGSELEVKFAGKADPGAVRQAMAKAGFEDATVQVIGSEAENSFLIRVGRVSMLSMEDAKRVEQSLKGKFGDNLQAFDFNPDFGDKIELRFKTPVTPEEISAGFQQAGIGTREVRAPVGGNYTVITSGISDKVQSALAEAKDLPKAELRRLEFVGPQVGKQLRNRGILSVLYAAIAILVYIAFRFDTRFAPGAVVAMFHDVIVVFGYYVVTGREFNLTSVAVLLTIVGYSVNDTIVIYDRIRENLEKVKGMPLPEMINRSINETLSRTILTGFSSILAMAGLLIFGVGQIWDFAAAMLVGIFVGTYSSIYVASPLTIWIDEITSKRQAPKAAAAKPAKAS